MTINDHQWSPFQSLTYRYLFMLWFNMWDSTCGKTAIEGGWRWMEDGDGWRMEAEAMAQQRRRWSVRPPLLSMLAEWSHALLFGRKCGHSLPKQSPRAPESWKKLKAEQLGLSGRPNHRTIPNLCACWLQLRQRSSHVYCNLWEICCNTPHVQRRSETLRLWVAMQARQNTLKDINRNLRMPWDLFKTVWQ